MSLLRPWQLVSVLALGMALLAVVLNWPDRRSAWDQAALTHGRALPEDPVRLSLWANELGPLFRAGEVLGPPPSERKALLRWLTAQCDINRQIQAVERRHGKPVDPESALGRPPFCRDLAFVRQRQP
jgi:hypothetical protein